MELRYLYKKEKRNRKKDRRRPNTIKWIKKNIY